ncbi:DUF1249 domain-containing protein [Isoalcanivorax beigongshangi]|uniref:DUF1249 domain-containing protein n=1 Tax=Isoalcanivorax beigongshangi TaxID=3238810 RepID=A0ABV4ADP1_9GAMM
MTQARSPRALRRYRVNLRELMTQCETNYAYLTRIQALLGDDDSLSLALGEPGAGRVVIRVLERSPYTTLLALEQDRQHALMPSARLDVRLYHDARSAEVVAVAPYRQVPARHDYPNSAMHQRDEKLQWNRFLSDWLRHVLAQGALQRPVWPQPPAASAAGRES